jgi:hypothetical protein
MAEQIPEQEYEYVFIIIIKVLRKHTDLPCPGMKLFLPTMALATT